jgi:LacI family transcriptional regulator
MGMSAAELLVQRIQFPDRPYPETVWFSPELVVRESTAAAPKSPSRRTKS